MAIKMSLQEAQQVYDNLKRLHREKEYLLAVMQRVKDTLEVGMKTGQMGEKAIRQCLNLLNEALGVPRNG
ncbi:MAG: hypothetical protein ACOY46_03135 [Bacillota bacterium]